MTASHVRPASAISSEIESREGLLDRLHRAASSGSGHSLRTAVVPVGTAFRRGAGAARDGSTRYGREWAVDKRAAEDDRMRLVAALLVLGTLLVWILFLQG